MSGRTMTALLILVIIIGSVLLNVTDRHPAVGATITAEGGTHV